MVKHIFILGVVVAFLCSCGDKGKNDKKETASKTKKDTVAALPPVPLDTADWVEKDLSTIIPQFHISMKVPKEAKIDTDINGDVVVHVNSFYSITVDYNSKLTAEDIHNFVRTDAFGDTMDGAAHHFTMLRQDPNGYVYSAIPKVEYGDSTPKREAHFELYVPKGKQVFKISNTRIIAEINRTPDSAFTEDIALKVYDIIKNSADKSKGKPGAKPGAKPAAKGHSKGKKHS